MTPVNATSDILLFCTRRPGVTDAAFAAALLAVASEVEVIELAMIMPADALPALAHVAETDDILPEAILTLRGPLDRTVDALPAAAAIIEPVVDRARSSVLAVQRHTILPGCDTIRLFFGLRRLDRLPLNAFHDYWLNHHADIGRRLLPPYSYHQLHTLPEATAIMAAATSIPASTLDGVVEIHFPDIAAFVKQLSRPEVSEEALVDERNFIDHARSIFWAYRSSELSA